MQEPLKITLKNLDPSPFLEKEVEHHVELMERFFPRIVSCHVTIEKPHRHHSKGRVYRVTVLLHLPGHDIVVGGHGIHRSEHSDVMLAIRDAFREVKRRLEDTSRIMRGDVKRAALPTTGIVVHLNLNEGYGFAETPEGDVYFHKNALVGSDFKLLSVGDEVRIVVAQNESPLGYQASTIRRTGRNHLLSLD